MKRRGWPVGILATVSGGSTFKSRLSHQRPIFFFFDLTVSFEENTRQDIAITQHCFVPQHFRKITPSHAAITATLSTHLKAANQPNKKLMFRTGVGVGGYSANKFNCFKTAALI